MKTPNLKYSHYLFGLSLAGLIASFWVTAEKIHLLKNPDAPLSCNLNPIIDCGIVLNHSLSSAFGVPNSMIGIVMFTALTVVGLIMLLGTKPSQTTRLLTLGLALIAMAFSVWFFVVSLYVIGKVCLFCIAIWTATIPLFVLSVREHAGKLLAKSKLGASIFRLFDHQPERLIIIIYVVTVALFLFRFRDYYFG